MIRKSGYRFSEKIMLKKKMERDDDSKKSHPALDGHALPFAAHPRYARKHPWNRKGARWKNDARLRALVAAALGGRARHRGYFRSQPSSRPRPESTTQGCPPEGYRRNRQHLAARLPAR